jgi:hypothetical protein
MRKCGVLACVRKAFQTWQNAALMTRDANSEIIEVPSVNLSIVEGGNIGVDINKDNYRANGHDYYQMAADQGIGIIIFDEDGSIMENYFGKENKFLLGVTLLERNLGGPTFAGGVIIFNGIVVDDINTTGNPELPNGAAAFGGTILHEIGHLLGLDHSQPMKRVLGATPDSAPSSYEGIPTMYPKLISLDQKHLNIDDVVGLSSLYPGMGFGSNFCTVKGDLKNAKTGEPLQGVNVVAYADITSGTAVDEKAISAVSNVSGSMYVAGQPNGQYTISGIVPGTPYRVVYEAVLSDFQTYTGGLNPYDPENYPNFHGPTEDDLANATNDISAGAGEYGIVACDIDNNGQPQLLANYAEDLGTQQAYITSSMTINMDSADVSPYDANNNNDDTTTDKKKGWCMSVAGGVNPVWGLIIPAVVGIITLARKRYKV